MLQEILTDLVVAIVLSFCAIVAFDFVVGLAKLGVPKTAPSLTEQLCAQPEIPAIAPVPVPDPWLETVVVPKSQSQTSWSQWQKWKPVLCLPPARVDKPDYSKCTAVQLRGICAAKGIAWRNAAPSGKHLTKNEMLIRLTA